MSPVLNLNLSEAQDFTPLPDDHYPVTVAEISEVKQGSKSQYVTVTFEVEAGHEFEGRRAWTNLMVNGKAAGMFVDFINKVLGTDYTIEEYRDSGIEIDTDDLVGGEIVIVTKQEEYPEGSGTFSASVKQVLAR